MKSNRPSPAWPYLVVLGVLFGLSVTAPRAWESVARQETVSELLEAQPPATRQRAPKQAATIVPTEPAEESLAHHVHPAQPVIVDPAPAFANETSSPDVRVAARSQKPEPTPAVQPVVPAAPAVRGWTVPVALLKQLAALGTDGPSAAWAQRVTALVEELGEPQRGRPSNEILNDLRALSSESERLAQTLGDSGAAARLLRVQLALARRLNVWQRINSLDEFDSAADAPLTADSAEVAKDAERMSTLLAGIEALVGKSPQGAAWTRFLMLDELRAATGEQSTLGHEERRHLAEQVLSRIDQARRASPSQSRFVAVPQIVALANQLRPWSTEPVSVAQLLADLEKFEQSGLASDAARMAGDCRALAWSGNETASSLAGGVEMSYANANCRLVASGKLLARFLPQPNETESPVNDTIAGARVAGTQRTLANLSLRLVPDARHLRLGLEATGRIDSDTSATSGPATFHSNGASSFLVRKLFVVGDNGLYVWPAVAQADSYYNNLVSLETDYDSVPIVGSLVRNIARSQHSDAQGQARFEIEQKVSSKARGQLDEQVQPRVAKATEQFKREVLARLEKLALDAAPVELSTTAERLTMRYRIAGQDQLGAHTPRPRALSDSLLSMQFHQSLLNNAIEKLELDGRKFKLPDLFVWLSQKLSRPELAAPEDLPDDVEIKFADHDAIRVVLADGQALVEISLTELSQGRKHWRDFTVRAFYRPEVDGLQARLVRESAIQLDGPDFKGKAELTLRSVFSKVLSHKRALNFMPERFATDPRLGDLEVNQFVVDDGWVALSYALRRGPADTAGRPTPRH